MKVDLYSLPLKVVGSCELDERIFDVPYDANVLRRVIDWQLASRRSGNHSSRNVSAISGTTAKPFKQKGTGRARQGSLRSPQFRGGAVVFGPVVRSHAYSLNKKLRQLALRVAMSDKLRKGSLVVLDELTVGEPKTGLLVSSLQDMAKDSLLMVDNSLNRNVVLAARNVPGVKVLPNQGLNVYDIIKHNRLMITKDAVNVLMERWL